MSPPSIGSAPCVEDAHLQQMIVASEPDQCFRMPPPSIGSAPRVDDAQMQQGSVVSNPVQFIRMPPPKIFRCFVCGKMFNERDYQRHIENFDKKAKRAMAGVFKFKKGTCPGIIHISHPVLRRSNA